MKILLPLILFLYTTQSFAQKKYQYKIYNTKYSQFITNESFIKEVPRNGHIILGESHYVREIHHTQAKIIKDIIGKKSPNLTFSTFWEFLVIDNENAIRKNFNTYKEGSLSMENFFLNIFPKGNLEKNMKYSPIIEITKKLNGDLLPTNAPRAIKRIITNSGLGSLDPKHIPYNMELGGENYLLRFIKAMNNHIPKEKMPYYFEAQSYTDSVIAHSLVHLQRADLKFLIIGSFHSDYNDGVIKQIKNISREPLTSIKVIKLHDFTEEKLDQFTKPHKIFGPLADYLYFVKIHSN